MRGMNGKVWVMGALASAALVFTGCKSESDEPLPSASPRIQIAQGRYGPIDAYPSGRTADDLTAEEAGTGGSGPAAKTAKGHKGHPMGAGDAGTPLDAGTSGATMGGSDSMGTMGQGVTGGSAKDTNAMGHTPSGGVPAPTGGH